MADRVIVRNRETTRTIREHCPPCPPPPSYPSSSSGSGDNGMWIPFVLLFAFIALFVLVCVIGVAIKGAP